MHVGQAIVPALKTVSELRVVEAEEMQQAVDHQMAEMIGRGNALGLGLGDDRLRGQHDVAEEARLPGNGHARRGREREDVRRLVKAAVRRVELANIFVGGERD